MALTIAQALTAGQLGVQGTNLTNALALLASELAANSTITSVVINFSSGNELGGASAFNLSDSQDIMTNIQTRLTNMLATVNTALSTM